MKPKKDFVSGSAPEYISEGELSSHRITERKILCLIPCLLPYR